MHKQPDLRQQKVLELLRKHKKDISDRYDILEIGTFGSIARDEALSTSDVDFVVKTDEFLKSLPPVMPDLIRHPELIELTGFRPAPE